MVGLGWGLEIEEEGDQCNCLEKWGSLGSLLLPKSDN